MGQFFDQVQLPDWTQINATFSPDRVNLLHNQALASDTDPARANQLLQIGNEQLRAAQLTNDFTAAAQPNKLNLMQQLSAPGAPAPAAIVHVPLAGLGGDSSVDGITDALGASEGGNNSAVVNKQGFNGQYQFGAPRLVDLGVYHPADGEVGQGGKWNGKTGGTFSIPGFPDVKTQADFLQSPDAQRAVMHLQVKDLQAQAQSIPGAENYDPVGLVAVGHLGGPTGMRRFVETNGQYDPGDNPNAPGGGTHLSDYYNKFRGNPGLLRAEAGHTDGPLGDDHPAMAHPAYQVASNSPVAPPAVDTQGRQPLQMDDTARNSVRELLTMQKLAIANGDMRSAAQFEARKEAIAGPGGIITPTGDVYIVPGAMRTRAAASNATEAGKIAPATQLAQNQAEIARNTHATNVGVDVQAAAAKGSQETQELGNRPMAVPESSTVIIPNQQPGSPNYAGSARQDGGALQAQPQQPGAAQPAPVLFQPASGPYHGNNVDAQSMNILQTQDPGSPAYAAAYAQLSAEKVLGDGTRVRPDMTPYRTPTMAPPSAAIPAATPGQPIASVPGGENYGAARVTPGDKMTDGQANAALYSDRMNAANKVLGDTEKVMLDSGQKYLGKIPVVGNYVVSADYQRAEQAQRDFVNAVLRRESGAAIAPSEFESAQKQYFPQPGDNPETLKQKAANRELAISGIQRAAGSGYRPPTTAPLATKDAPFPVKTVADYQGLKSGSLYIDPDGHTRRKP